MSNRLRVSVMDDRAVAQVQRELACPDCRSRVTLNRKTRQVDIAHDDHCPTLRALRRAGRTVAVAVVPREGESAEDYAQRATKVTVELARRHEQIWPGSLGVRVAPPYAELDHLDRGESHD